MRKSHERHMSWLCWFMTGVASAQETTGTLAGKLSRHAGPCRAGSDRHRHRTARRQDRSSATPKAVFRHPSSTPGVYDVRAELQGFKAVDVKAVTVSLGQTT